MSEITNGSEILEEGEIPEAEEAKPIPPGKQSRKKRCCDNGKPNPPARDLKYTPYMLGKLASQYFADCDSTVVSEDLRTGLKTYKPKLKSGLISYLKVGPSFLQKKRADERFAEVMEYIDWETLASIEEGMMVGRYNPTSSIFHLKNHYGQTDKTEIKSEVDTTIKITFE